MGDNTGPSRWFYGLAILIMFAGSAVFVIFLIQGLSGLTRGMTQIIVPGTHEIMLHEAGTYTVYYEYKSFVNGKVYTTGETLRGLQCMVKEKATNSEIELSSATSASNYSMGSRSGTAIFQFTVKTPGAYEFHAWYSGTDGQDIVLAIGRDFTMKLFSMILASIAILFGSWIAGAIVAIMTFAKRRKAAKTSSPG
jgi:hypothetical protein